MHHSLILKRSRSLAATHSLRRESPCPRATCTVWESGCDAFSLSLFFFFIFNKSFIKVIICRFILFGLYIQEEKKGKLPTGLVLQSFSFFSNISIIISFFLALLCSPSDYWELWVGGLTLMISWLQLEYWCCFQQFIFLTSCKSPFLILRLHLPLFYCCFWGRKALHTSRVFGSSSRRPYLPQ